MQHTTDTIPTESFTHISNNKNVMLPGMKIFNLHSLEKYAREMNESLRHCKTSHEHSLQQNLAAISP